MIAAPRGAGLYLIVLAGPNGAGKSTFYELFLEGLPLPFINADRIARTAFPGRASVDYEAAKIADAERRRLVAEGQSFAPGARIARRFGRSLANLRTALRIVDHAYLYDNSANPFARVAEVSKGRTVRRALRLPRWLRPVLPPAGANRSCQGM